MGGRLKEGLLWPLFPPRQWPVNLLDQLQLQCKEDEEEAEGNKESNDEED